MSVIPGPPDRAVLARLGWDYGDKARFCVPLPPIPHLGFQSTCTIQPRGYPLRSVSSVLISGEV
jgi:hypothetical protein